jgi:hypothetical protein
MLNNVKEKLNEWLYKLTVAHLICKWTGRSSSKNIQTQQIGRSLGNSRKYNCGSRMRAAKMGYRKYRRDSRWEFSRKEGTIRRANVLKNF